VSRFCRHNRFVERCPICRETAPGYVQPEGAGRRARGGEAGSTAHPSRAATGGQRRGAPPGRRRGGLHVSHERRAEDDGYRSPLAPGLRSSEDAARLAEELAFADGRLLALTTAPPGLYGEVRELADVEQALWACFLSAYLCPLEGEDPFVSVRLALAAGRSGELPDLSALALGPRTSHDPARGDATLRAYLQWAERADRSQIGQQQLALTGDPAWTPERRFARIFERLTLPGFGRAGRYELLVTVGRLGLCDLRADSLHLAGAGADLGDLATVGAKRVFGIGDPLHLEPRAQALADAAAVPIEALDLALANWEAGARATLGVSPEVLDHNALERARAAFEL
jgi:hypothetical protein